MKLLIISHFSNPAVRTCLPLGSRRIYSFARKLLRLSQKKAVIGDVSPWTSCLIDNLKGREDLELYVLGSHQGMSRYPVEFDIDGVHYCFVGCEGANALKYLVRNPSLWCRLNPLNCKVRRFVDMVSPDLIALVGAENGFIAGTVLGLFDYPLIIQCQTIYNNPERSKFGYIDPVNAYVESELFKKAKYVAIPTKMHYDLFKKMDSQAQVVKWKALTSMPDVYDPEIQKEFDFVTFAVLMCRKKGYFDAVEAFAKVSKTHPGVRLNLVGGGAESEKQELRNLCESLGVASSVVFTDFFEEQADMLRHIQKSRFALLPSLLDYTSGTMNQAMFYRLPLVCYETKGTPNFNKERECALIARSGDTDDLAAKMSILLDDPAKVETLRENAYRRAVEKLDMKETTDTLVATYKAVYDNAVNGTPIPDELLYHRD